MKYKIIKIIMLLVLSFGYVNAQLKPFEGVIYYTIETINLEDSTNIKLNYVYFINVNKFRTENQETKEFYIVDENRTTEYMPDSKIYMETTKAELDADEIHQTIKKESELLYKFTDEKKEILGYTCYKITYKYKNAFTGGYNECEIWGIKDRNVVMPCPNFDINTNLMDECFEFKIIPLLITNKLDGGMETTIYTATKIIEKKLPVKIFQGPKDYKKYEIPIPADDNFGDEDDY